MEKERKNTSWMYNLNTHKLTALFPDNVNAVYDLTRLVEGLSQQQELVYQYGVKQWLASNWAGCPSSMDKRVNAEADFQGLCEKGIELFGEGKIGIIGKERKNGVTIDKKVEAIHTTLSAEEIMSTLKMVELGFIKLSKEMLEKLNARKAELEKN